MKKTIKDKIIPTRFEKAICQRIQRIADRKKLPVSIVIRQAVDEYIARDRQAATAGN